jgi:hypothetical protein
MGILRTAVAGLGGLLTLWLGWGAYVSKTTERVPFERVGQFDGVELRQYPRSVLVETTAPDTRTAFRRLFRYINGANERRESVSMTAPVATRGGKIPMTAPVRTSRERGGPATNETGDTGSGTGTVTMGFYLPGEYTPESTPTPTDRRVTVTVEPAQTVAVRQFSWYATAERVARERERLLRALARRRVETRGDPVLFQYNDPWTPPFMRTNEVAVPVDPAANRRV